MRDEGEAQDDDEDDDPFRCNDAPARSASLPPLPIAQPRKTKLSSTLLALQGGKPGKAAASSSMMQSSLAGSNKRVKKTHPATALFAGSIARKSSPSPTTALSQDSAASSSSPTAAASSSSSSSSPAASQQASMDDFFNPAPAAASSASASSSSRRAAPAPEPEWRRHHAVTAGRNQSCPKCDEILLGVTIKDHERVCKPIPDPVKFTLNTDRERFVVEQHLGARLAQGAGAATPAAAALLSGSTLYRIRSLSLLPSESDRRKAAHVLRWVSSVLRSNEGRDLAREDAETAAALDGLSDPEWSLRSTQELFVFVTSKSEVAAAVVVNTDLSRCNLTPNTVAIQSHAGPIAKQRSLEGFCTPIAPPAAAAAAETAQGSAAAPSAAAPASPPASSSSSAPASAASSAFSSDATNHRPLFGVDKIVVHAQFRLRSSAARSSAAASAAPSSLASHVLSSILALHARERGITSLPRDRVAFSEPTELGRRFAARFTGTSAFFTYSLPVFADGDEAQLTPR